MFQAKRVHQPGQLLSVFQGGKEVSSWDKQPRQVVMAAAERMIDLLRPCCQRIEIAGSLRRELHCCGDAEIVLIPRMIQYDLFGEEILDQESIEGILTANGLELVKNGPYYKQTTWKGVGVDLFITTPQKWGCIFTIRTGSAGFAKRLVTQKLLGGYCPDHLVFSEGRIWNKGKPLETPEELDVFKAVGMQFIVPQKRD